MDVQRDQRTVLTKPADVHVGILHGYHRAKGEVSEIEIISGFSEGGDLRAISVPSCLSHQALPAGAVAVIASPDSGVNPPTLIEVGGLDSATAGIKHRRFHWAGD
jgi:hypothetical protein